MTSPIKKFSAPYTLHRYSNAQMVKGRKVPRAEVFKPTQNEIQALTIKLYSGAIPDGGGLHLNWNGQDAGWVYWPTTGGSLASQVATFAASVQTALAALGALTGNVTAVGSTSTDAVGNVSALVTVTYQAALANSPVQMISSIDGPITTGGSSIWSYWSQVQPGVAANTPLTVSGSFQPLNPREIALLSEGERATEQGKFFTEDTLHMADQTTGQLADRIEARGRLWEVKNITTLDADLGFPYLRAALTLIESSEVNAS